MTQRQVAIRSGHSQACISAIANGKTNARATTIADVFAAMGAYVHIELRRVPLAPYYPNPMTQPKGPPHADPDRLRECTAGQGE